MREWFVLSVAVVCMAAGCSDSGMPGPGDTVSPRIVDPLNWSAGQTGMLRVELHAKNKTGQLRRLGFAVSPTTNPVAQVQFFDADGQAIELLDVELSKRC